MKRDYLWDGTGEPDAAIAALEEALAPARYDEAVDLPAAARAAGPAEEVDGDGADGEGVRELAARRAATRRPRRWARPAIAVGVVAAAAALAAIWQLRSADRGEGAHRAARTAPALPPPVPSRGGEAPAATGVPVEVTALAGTPLVGESAVGPGHRLTRGEWLVTDHASHALLAMEGIGEVSVGPGSRVRLVESAPSEQRLELGRGALHARVFAPPRLFVVDLPSATAFDLGCEYELAVDEAGVGVLRVLSGEVSLEGHGRASLVPAGAECETRPGAGPGTPYRTGAASELVGALRRYDFERGGRPALDAALERATAEDTLTLWHLQERATGADRTRVLERLARLAPPPSGLRIERPEPEELEAWRGALEARW